MIGEKTFCNMASSASGRDQPNPALWLATQTGKMAWSSPAARDYALCAARENYPKRKQKFLTKLVRSRWLDIDLVRFCEFMDLNSSLVHKLAKKNLLISSHLDLALGQKNHICISLHVTYRSEWRHVKVCIIFSGALAMEALHRQVLPFLLRRLKEDVLQDLPPKIIQDYYCELSPLQVSLCTLSLKVTVICYSFTLSFKITTI